jgi:hypothetical protein
MSINTHGIITHCKSVLVTRSIIQMSDTLTWSPLYSRLDRHTGKLPTAARHGLPTNSTKDKPMELILIILLLVVLFGGGFGFYRGGYYRQGGPVGIGGILGLILVVLAIGWLVHGHIGGLSL